MNDSTRDGCQSLETLVSTRQKLRRAWEPETDAGPFIVVGRPADWGAAFDEITRSGRRVLAFNDRCFGLRRPLFRWRPVLPGRWRLAPKTQWLYAGVPSKRYFDAAPESVNRCLWQVPSSAWGLRRRQDRGLLKKHRTELGEVLAGLCGARSKITYASLIRGRLEGDLGFPLLADYPEYCHPIVRARRGDVVIDAGAFSGDSARRFAWWMQGLGTIVSLEPDPKNFARLVRCRIPGLRPLELGVWNQAETLTFRSKGGSGKVSPHGEKQVHVLPIDAIVRQERLPRVDLIKLDVEGAERQALEGARDTIRRFRPKLQVSIYHRPRDLFELPLQLMRQWPNYHWYLGHHGPWHTETDLYGMPSERLGKREQSTL